MYSEWSTWEPEVLRPPVQAAVGIATIPACPVLREEHRQPKVGINWRTLLNNATELRAVANPRSIVVTASPYPRTTDLETPMHRHLTPTALSMIAIGTLAFGAAVLPAHAATITVCPDGSCDFTDPAAAVSTAVTGDIVVIAAGTYPLNASLLVYAQAITVRGAVDAQGRPATVLDGQGARVVLSMTSITGQATFENLVFANGRADYGGGVFVAHSSPVFRNCHFRDNVAVWHGGALYNSSASPTLIDCELTGNTAGNAQFPLQGVAGAVLAGNRTTTMIGCTVSQNSTNGSGGAFSVSTGGTLVLRSTRVCGNTAPTHAQIAASSGATVTELDGACISNDCSDCPTSPPCNADLNADGTVNGFDLSQVLAQWGPCSGTCTADTDSNGTVDGLDLAVVLAGWGSCS